MARAALDHRYDYTLLPPLALSASVPKADAPDAKWLVQIADQLVQIAVHSGRVDLVEERTDPAHHAALGASVKDGGIAGFRVALSGLNDVVMRGRTTGRAEWGRK